MAQLAIDGGPKTRDRSFPGSRWIGNEELKELVDVIYSQKLNRVAGTKVSKLEKEFSELYGVNHGIASTSGTSSIHVALGAINPDPGSEVITTGISDMGSIIPILAQNCIPIFADMDPKTYSMDPDDLKDKISERTKAVIAIHLFGLMGNMEEIRDICDENDIYLIEDACQAHMAESNQKLAGTYGHFGCFSFQQSKQITCGDGGMTITDDPDLASRARLFADKAWPREGGWAKRGYLFFAMNYRMTELQGAVALAQLKKVKAIVDKRRKLASQLSAGLEEAQGVNTPWVPEGSKHSWWLYPITIDQELLGVTPEEFAKAVSEEGIPISQGYIKRPLYMFPVLTEKRTYGSSHCPFDCPIYGKEIEYRKGLCPETERILEEVITLRVWESWEESDVQDAAEGIIKVSDHYAKP